MLKNKSNEGSSNDINIINEDSSNDINIINECNTNDINDNESNDINIINELDNDIHEEEVEENNIADKKKEYHKT